MNLPDASDRELVELCLQDGGQEQAWTEFLRRFQPVIARVVASAIRRRIQPTRNLVDDLVQTTLRKLCDNNCRAMRIFRWQHENAFRGFLGVTSSNVVNDYFRKHPITRVEVDPDDVDPKVLEVKPFTHGVEMEVFVEKLIGCLQKLLHAEDDCKRSLAIFLLYYRQGLTAKQISRLYPLTIKAVENTLLRLVRLARGHCI